MGTRRMHTATVSDHSPPPVDVGRHVVEFALRAPSVHNTQPWSWRVRGLELDLYADRDRQLPLADPTGRNLTVSCGAALHYAVAGAAAAGWSAQVDLLPDDDPDHLAVIRLAPAPPTRHALAHAELLRARATDRRRFIGWPVPIELLDRLATAAAVPPAMAQVRPVARAVDRVRLELLLSRAVSAEHADRRLADEQHRWLRATGSVGIPLPNLHPADADDLPPAWPSRFDRSASEPGAHLVGDVVDVTPHDGLAVVLTATDAPAAWLHAGDVLCRFWAAALDHGLSVVPLSQVVEGPETRAALQREVLGEDRCPQLLLRVGWQELSRSSLPRTPRRDLEDVLLD